MFRNVCKTSLKFTFLGVKKTCKSKLVTIFFLEGDSPHLKIDQLETEGRIDQCASGSYRGALVVQHCANIQRADSVLQS